MQHRNIFEDLSIQTLRNYWGAYFPEISFKWIMAAVSLGILVFIVVFYNSEREHRQQGLVTEAAFKGLAAFYGVLLLAMLALDRGTGESGFNLIPFWSYRQYFSGSLDLLYVNILNVILFLPFGLFLFIALERKNGKRKAFIGALLTGFFLSLSVELLQFLLARGYAEFDDVFHNTLGTALGAVLAICVEKLYRCIYKYCKRRMTRRDE